MTDAWAVVGGRLAVGCRDVTSDPAALDSSGFWVVVATFEGEFRCVRMADERPVGEWYAAAPPWPRIARQRWTTSMDRTDYLAGVQFIRDRIAAGDVYQVNLCRLLTADADLPDVRSLGAALAQGNPAPYAASICIPEAGLYVASASPELFLSRDGDYVASAPIKGTAPRSDAFTDKDRAENVMIVDLVRNDLARVCEPGSVEVPDLLAVEEHPGLSHLVSRVRGELRSDVGWAELIDATMPPGSVSGAPKLAALDVIRKLEPVPRGPYCGAVGWVDADRRVGTLAVGIRTFSWADGRLALGTGAGITWGSDPAAEWDETELKVSRLLEVA